MNIKVGDIYLECLEVTKAQVESGIGLYLLKDKTTNIEYFLVITPSGTTMTERKNSDKRKVL